MGILDTFFDIFGGKFRDGGFLPDRTPVAEQSTRIQVTLDLSRIHDKRHMGLIGYFGHTWEENAGIGIMNTLVAAGIPMDWRHFISWCGDRLAAEGYRPTHGKLTFNKDPDFTVRSEVQITWTAD